jgi:hypothetical protein
VGFLVRVFASFNAEQSKINVKSVQMFAILRLIKLQKTHNAGILATNLQIWKILTKSPG